MSKSCEMSKQNVDPSYIAMLQALSPIWEDLQPYKWLPGLEGVQDEMASCMSQIHSILQCYKPCHRYGRTCNPTNGCQGLKDCKM